MNTEPKGPPIFRCQVCHAPIRSAWRKTCGQPACKKRWNLIASGRCRHALHPYQEWR